jgi:uncharacterized membrane protein (UPF0182 family)
MLYVEPVYVQGSQENAVPLLQKVLMSYGDGGTYVVLADSLKAGLEELVTQGKAAGTGQPPSNNTPPNTGGNNNTPTPALPGQLAAAATQVDAAIKEVKAAQQSGDFVRYGQALQKLDVAMTAFQAAQAASGTTPAPSTAPSTGASGAPVPTPSG